MLAQAEIFEPEVLVKLGMAVLLGGLVGLEREFRGRAAGLRTMIIVCLGSTVVMVVSSGLQSPFPADAGQTVVRVDPGRIAAGIVTGVGFLGAGVILKIRDLIRGVTTAACIWFVAGVGIAVGQGMYVLAALATVLCLFTLWGLHFIERTVRRHVYRTLSILVERARSEEVLDKVRGVLAEHEASTMDLEVTEDRAAGTTRMDVAVRALQDFPPLAVVRAVSGMDGVRRASWGAVTS